MKFKALLLTCAIATILAIPASAQDKCKAVTKSGTQCTRKAVSDGYCNLHNPASTHCAGTTKAGKPCQRIPKKGEKYCFNHKKQG